ncbi:cellulose biosynthesis protein BcsQ [Novosphingobium fluoreni]|uniref:Cellulose biosynthesis protein BcsQ n=1 Tax=Novosphingobium fluoreni TaxID=1391222 RepID=A0A7W6C121_9SPHN|nr:ParA family protein [Novosphingobium fluoreni]MBB3940190.1 cellulose biosynthesis protein BcsQ [Novosphingobium fluoreni]
MPNRILLFNHKGGVGKTTSAYNLGWKLWKRGHRVLLVDGDSQVNLTSRAMGANFEDYYDEDGPTYRNNIYDSVRPVFEGRPTPIEAFDCPLAENSEGLFILPGHPDLSSLEGQISLAQETRGTLSVTKNLPGALHKLISLAEERHKIDFSIIDINPGLGALNQNFFMISHGFIVPTNPDPFSLMSLKTLGFEIERWISWKQTFGPAFADATYPLPSGVTKFLGALHSRFNRHKSKAAGRYNERIAQIDARIENELVPALRMAGCLFPQAAYEAAAKVELPEAGRDPSQERLYALARIPDFAQLSHIAAEFGKPVFDINDDDLRIANLRGHLKKSVQDNVATFDAIFSAICEKIEIIVAND